MPSAIACPRNHPTEEKRLARPIFRRIEALERRTDLPFAALAVLLHQQLAPGLYRDRRRRGRPAVCETREERVEVLAMRRQRKQCLWHRGDVVTMPVANENTCPRALRTMLTPVDTRL